MATVAQPRSTPLSRMTTAQWIFLLLLVLSICINYIDRGSLGIAGPILTKELKLDPYQLGILLSAFFWTYAPMQIVSGWLVDRFNVNWVYGIGFFLWSAATMFTGFIGSFASLLVLRTLLGMGESVAYPSYSKIIVENFPEHHRGLANGLIDAGSKLGPALGVLLGGLFMAQYGWRVFFWAMGGASLLWLVPWVFFAPRDRIAEIIDKVEAPGLLKILKVRSAWGTSLGLFCGNYVWYFILTWLPSYLVNERHYSPHDMAIIGSIPYAAVALSSGLTGFFADRIVARGHQPIRVRKISVALGMMLSTLILPAAMTKDQLISMLLLTAGCFGFGLFSGIHWALLQSLAGPLASGKWTGFTNAVGNLAGVIAPAFTGWVVRETGQFYYAFVVCAVVAMLGAFAYTFVIDRKEPVDWCSV